MRLHITLNLPGRNGSLTQYVICDHPAETLEDFCDLLNTDDHVLVHQADTDRMTRDLVPGEAMIINQNICAKVSPYHPRNF